MKKQAHKAQIDTTTWAVFLGSRMMATFELESDADQAVRYYTRTQK